MDDLSELREYLEVWRSRCSYEHTAMSEAVFSSFLEGLIDLLDAAHSSKPESPELGEDRHE